MARGASEAGEREEEYRMAVAQVLMQHKEALQLFNPALEQDVRTEVFEWICEQGDVLRKKFAWAIPSPEAITAIAAFSPLVEVGCGAGYWAHLLRSRGCDIVAYDKYLPPKEERWTEVLAGGPDILEEESNADRTLFLCYPDASAGRGESLAMKCFYRTEADTIIHAGELFGDSVLMRGEGPWGRTTAKEFQIELATKFHCILKMDLPRWPISGDALTIWRRHTASPIAYGNDDSSDDENGSIGGSGGGGSGSGGGGSSGSGSSQEDIAAGSEEGASSRANGRSAARNDSAVAGDAAAAVLAGKESRKRPRGPGAAARKEELADDSNEDENEEEVQDTGEEVEDRAEGSEGSGQEGGEGGGVDWYAYIPHEEMLCRNMAADCVRHLLPRPDAARNHLPR